MSIIFYLGIQWPTHKLFSLATPENARKLPFSAPSPRHCPGRMVRKMRANQLFPSTFINPFRIQCPSLVRCSKESRNNWLWLHWQQTVKKVKADPSINYFNNLWRKTYGKRDQTFGRETELEQGVPGTHLRGEMIAMTSPNTALKGRKSIGYDGQEGYKTRPESQSTDSTNSYSPPWQRSLSFVWADVGKSTFLLPLF